MKRGLSREEIIARRRYIGGSDARIIVGSNIDAILSIWHQKRGEEEAPDLRWELEVQMGLVTEGLNLEWYEHETGRAVNDRQVWEVSFEHPWMAATVDGMDLDHPAGPIPVECKHCSAYLDERKALEKYYPQLQHIMVVTQSQRIALSVFFGTHTYKRIEVELDPDYVRDLIAAERYFMECVRTGTPPVLQTFAPPHDPTVKIDMAGNNMWADAATRWLLNKASAKHFDKAVADLKEAMPPEAGTAFGHGVTITRSKDGKRFIKETK